MKFDQWPKATIELGKISGVAVAYFVTGKLTVLLAIPPGYASPVWPAAGIALGSIRLFGLGVWPGILIGSLLVNVSTAVDAMNSEPVLSSVVLPTIIAVGATLQAIAGTSLLNRTVPVSMTLVQLEHLFYAMVYSGPISCLINASISTLALFLTGAIQTSEIPTHAWTWWLGDAIGVLLIVP